MVKIKDRITSSLYDLIGISQDGQKGYRLAAKKERSREVKLTYDRFADQKMRLTDELLSEFMKFDENPEPFLASYFSSPTTEIFSKKIAEENSSEAIVDLCEREESKVLHVYQSVREIENLPLELYHVVERQYAQVKSIYCEIVDLRRYSLKKLKLNEIDPLN